MVGRTLQRYRILEQVGHGGMAVVYRGVDEALEREVAVKLLHPHLAERVEHRRRLAREAKAVARLHHPNILEIYDFSGEDSPEAYLVTELIRGRTLRAFATEHPFDPPELAAACVHELAGALAHAHAQGIVHRDLKPDNVMIREVGAAPVVKLMDFGIAQIIDRDERMTVTGSLIGSPAHMAPEIIDGEEADQRSDVFSLGTILYWLSTGQLPFEAPSPGALLKRILEGEYQDPREWRPGMSDSLAQVIADALARDREARIQTASDFQARLAKTLSDTGLERPAELLARFLAEPAGTARDVRSAVVQHLMAAGDRASQARRTARALAAYSRIIAIVPGTPEAGAARQAIDRLKARARWRRHVALGSGLAAAAAVAFLVTKNLPDEPPPPPEGEAVATAPAAPAPRASVVEPGPVTIASKPAAFPPLPATSGEAKRPPRTRAPAPVPAPAPQPKTAPAKAAPVPALAPATVSIKVEPYADISIDGVFRAQRKVYDESLPPGRHRFRFAHSCCRPLELEAVLEPGQPFSIQRQLEPLPGRIELALDGPTDTQIMVDDAFRCFAYELQKSPIWVHMDPEPNGSMRYDREVVVRLYKDGYGDKRIPVKVYAGRTEKISVRLEPAR